MPGYPLIQLAEMGFAHSYRCTARWMTLSRSHRPANLFVEIHASGSSWIGEFPGYSEHVQLSGLFCTPAPSQLLVVNHGDGCLVSTDDGCRKTPLDIYPLIGLRRVEGAEILLYWGFNHLGALDGNGPLWRIEGLSIDDLEVDTATVASIQGSVWRPTGPPPMEGEAAGEDDRIPFLVDTLSGEIMLPPKGSPDRAWVRHGMDRE